MKTAEEIIDLFRERGDSEYGGEAVTQLEHALQAAQLAQQENAHAELVVAALLHDVGHLLHDLPDDAPDTGVDDHHENSGFHFLKSLFPPSVVEPVRMHVDAKRYLCAIDAEYMESLSEPSKVSLRLQGGPMNQQEIEEFERNEFLDDAVRLRRWDDQAKIVGLETPALSDFAPMIEKVIHQGTAN